MQASRDAHRILINASNLHVGGGVQVASSFLSELATLRPPGMAFDVVASTPVDASLRDAGVDVAAFATYSVVDTHGARPAPPALRRAMSAADLVFTVFGPLYAWRKPRRSLVGFAQAWIIYPDTDAYARLSFPTQLRTRLKFALQALAFARRSDALVVEAEHVARRLSERGIAPRERISVVPNTLNGVFLTPDAWLPVECGPRAPGVVRIGIVSRDYPHKNLDLLPDLKSVLKTRHGIDAAFYVTLSQDEIGRRSPYFRAATVNVGPLAVAQCPRFYAQMDAVIFPSLLECFSATPLEALYMRKPLFAPDRPFVRDICGEHAEYFDPNSAADAAETIARSLAAGPDPEALEAGRQHVLARPDARARALSYIAEMSRRLAETRA